MSANQTSSLLARAGTVSAMALATVGATVLAPGQAQAAQPARAAQTSQTSQAAVTAVSAKALQVAAAKKGSPYRWGGTGPRAFDCSGLTLYAFRHAGRSLPRTAEQQYRHTAHVARAARRTGDLVFFHSGGSVYHVGIYAGHGRIWHAPKTGAVVRLERIWTHQVSYGRVK
ncbi:C40 family peptidase [Streptomyces sp. NPDC059740]|uniref:C40 family peptidase n=1 Tax=Streptomyces sp. NPDC059740 TaxID=3346926 RepID=UPI003669259E